MATAKRTTTSRAASAKAGAAPAVAKDTDLTVESSDPITVDAPLTMEQAEAAADREDARQAAQAQAEAAKGAPAPAPGVELADPEVPTHQEVTPGAAQGARALLDAADADLPASQAAGGELGDPTADEAPTRDLSALLALADTSGRDPVTPYGAEAVPAPAPAPVLPRIRDTHYWCADGDIPARGRVLVDGFRIKLNGGQRFARLGDIINAPEDVIANGVSRGVLHRED